MNAPRRGILGRITAHPWRVAIAALVLGYCPLLGYLATTTTFAAAAQAQRRIAQILSLPPAPPQLPVLKTFGRLDLPMQRDPLQPLGKALPESKPPADAAASERYRFVASYRDNDQPCVVSRDDAGQLGRFCVGDAIGAGTIERISTTRVTVAIDGKAHVVGIAAEP